MSGTTDIVIPTPKSVLHDAVTLATKSAAALAPLAAFHERLESRGGAIVDLMITNGLLPHEKRAQKLAAYASNPASTIDDLATLAGHVTAPSIGEASGTKSAAATLDRPETADEAYERKLREGQSLT